MTRTAATPSRHYPTVIPLKTARQEPPEPPQDDCPCITAAAHLLTAWALVPGAMMGGFLWR